MATQQRFVDWLGDLAEVMAREQGALTDLDSAIGDADHGSNMARGTAAVADLLDDEFADTATLLKKAGMTLVSTVGGASGPLYGTFFMRMAGPLAGIEDVSAAELGAALRAGVEGVQQRGKAEPGDKTMYDAWLPALEAYDAAVAADADIAAALEAAATAAAQGRDATEPWVAKKGRASYLGERSAGHIDPGAASTTLLLESAARTLR
ncbi:dihydroxyacetone kinase subunit DhaL [Luteipulveratus halotolerans]|uniref:Dihydroxyacetone kinase n=1 Tax=Luteipulveratus halotolerans TaxID=1631356 RepID=A0A0L6CFZ5_9MICO|nr:dihydroxyacetone kinase subunit DhaL [Luteipulveratus halotolerans]KNX36751.1 dihydroxyacetone kinase [Luteipulveratus halotolerans]